jgi:hypothetical protein
MLRTEILSNEREFMIRLFNFQRLKRPHMAAVLMVMLSVIPALAALRLEVPQNFDVKGALGTQNARFQVEFHVNGNSAAAADTNAGTAQQPFKSMARGIKAAFEAQTKGQSARLRIHPRRLPGRV